MTEEEMRSCQSELRKKDAALEQIELLLHRMYYLAEQSLLADNQKGIDRQKLQSEMENTKERVEQILADLKIEDRSNDAAYMR